MHIHFVLNVHACAVYIVSYISKAQKEMGELLRNAFAETRKGNSTIKDQVRDIKKESHLEKYNRELLLLFTP